MRVISTQVSSTTLPTRIIISMTMGSIRSRGCIMIRSSIFKLNTSIKMIILLKTMKRETLKKMRFHSKTTRDTHLLIIIIRSPSNSSSNNRQHRHLTSTRSQLFSINTKQMRALTTTCLLKAGWWMEEAQILTWVHTNKGIVPYHRPQ